jgi:hypothetical protein
MNEAHKNCMDGRRFWGGFLSTRFRMTGESGARSSTTFYKIIDYLNYVSYYLINNVLTEEDNNNNSNWPLPRVTKSITHLIR